MVRRQGHQADIQGSTPTKSTLLSLPTLRLPRRSPYHVRDCSCASAGISCQLAPSALHPAVLLPPLSAGILRHPAKRKHPTRVQDWNILATWNVSSRFWSVRLSTPRIP